MTRMVEHFNECATKAVDLHRLAEDHDTASVTTLVQDMAEEIRLWRAGHLGLHTVDLVQGQLYPTIIPFQLLVRDGVLLSEDSSFLQRWQDIGGKVWLYIGAGSPIAHYGSTCYQGSIEDLGFTRSRS